MIHERQAIKINESVAIIIPAELARYLKLKPNDKVFIKDEEGKHGVYISIWTKHQKK